MIDGLDQIGLRAYAVGETHETAQSNSELCRLWCEGLQDFLQESQWSKAHRTPVALCCRDEKMGDFEYVLVSGQFQIVIVKSPEVAEVVASLRADPKAAGLVTELERNSQLSRLAQVPLFMQMILSVFRDGTPYRPLENVSDDEQIDELIASYVELRLSAGTALNRAYTIPLVRRWLAWLARNQNRSPFLIELMQPDMLAPSDQSKYAVLAACILGITVSLIATLPVATELGTGGILTCVLSLQQSGIDVPSQPNHGIVRSTWNAVILSCFALLIATPVITLSYAYQFSWQTGLENGILAPVILCGVLIFGGVPVFQHWALRLLSAARGFLPIRLVTFLNAMTDMMLIQRVGGGYRFRHDLVRAFFARGSAPRVEARRD